MKKVKTVNLKEHRKRLMRRECLGKIQHKSMTSAQYILDMMSGNLSIYTCTFCGYLHIGHDQPYHIKKK